MIYRYGTDSQGRRVRACVYTEKEHPLRKDMIAPQALQVIKTLRRSGYQAYIVGGAIRDLLLNKKPKDFDVATDAVPGKIKKIFSNAWIIGKRFKLAHIHFANRYIVEVTTFRSASSDHFNAVYGTIDEDVNRRDFTANALFYDPEKEQLIDYVGGYNDIKAGRLHNVIPLSIIFDSDPVRMIRAAKYVAKCDFKVSFKMKHTIVKKAPLIATISASRLTEEFFKILSSGRAVQIFKQLERFHLLAYFLPNIDRILKESKGSASGFYHELEILDRVVKEQKDDDTISRDDMVFFFVKEFLPPYKETLSYFENYSECKKFCKELESPLQIPVACIESAVRQIFLDRDGVQHQRRVTSQRPRQRSRHPRRRSRGSVKKENGTSK